MAPAKPTNRDADKPVRLPVADVPPPLLHHPVVGTSLVLMTASLAQLAVWLVNVRLLASQLPADVKLVNPSAWVSQDFLFQATVGMIEQFNTSTVPNHRILFSICLALALLSTMGWYTSARMLLGPAWGLWCGVLWSVHPLFAFLAQRPTALSSALVLVPFSWAVLIWWARTRHRRIAFAAGVVTGMSALICPAMLLVFILASPCLLLATGMQRKSWQGVLLVWLGLAIPLAAMAGLIGAHRMADPRPKLKADLMAAIDNGDGSSMALAARAAATRGDKDWAPLGILAGQCTHAPVKTGLWLAGRVWQCIYSTADQRLERPLFAIQLAVLLPALWGGFVILRHPDWKWAGVATLILVLVIWLNAALVEPLARNVVPVGGAIILFAAVALADVYERAFGRRLIPRGDDRPRKKGR